MIINRLKNHVELHSRVELYRNRTLPTIEVTVVRSNLALEPTIELTYEQAQSVVDTLNRLIAAIDRHAATMPVTHLHPRAEALIGCASNGTQRDGGADPQE
jgi:hypothetical protein